MKLVPMLLALGAPWRGFSPWVAANRLAALLVCRNITAIPANFPFSFNGQNRGGMDLVSRLPRGSATRGIQALSLPLRKVGVPASSLKYRHGLTLEYQFQYNLASKVSQYEGHKPA